MLKTFGLAVAVLALTATLSLAGPRGDSAKGGDTGGQSVNSKGTEANFADAKRSWNKFLDSRTQEDYDSFIGSYADCRCTTRLKDFPTYPE